MFFFSFIFLSFRSSGCVALCFKSIVLSVHAFCAPCSPSPSPPLPHLRYFIKHMYDNQTDIGRQSSFLSVTSLSPSCEGEGSVGPFFPEVVPEPLPAFRCVLAVIFFKWDSLIGCRVVGVLVFFLFLFFVWMIQVALKSVAKFKLTIF